MTEVITYHGWAFYPGIWKTWEHHLPDNVRIAHASRGYFGDRANPQFSDKAKRKVLVVHSYGLHWCPDDQIEEADHLVILSGFLSFHPKEPDEERRSRFILRQMMSRFVEAPEEVLTRFYENVCAPEHCDLACPSITSMNHEQLLEDLADMDNVNLSSHILSDIHGVTVIHGGNDRIVSREKARTIYSLLTLNARYLEIRDGGHAVGFTNTEECLKFLTPILQLNSFRNDETRKE